MYSEKTLIVDIVTNGSGDDVWYSLSAPGEDIISALRTGDVLLRKITRTERNNAATPAVPQSDEYDYFKLVSVRDVEDGSQVAMLFDNGDIYVYDPNENEYPCLDGIEPGNISLVPSATAEDAGKVLTVNDNGLPSWAAGGGSGGGVLVVTVDGTTLTLNKTWKEIHDNPVAVILDDNGNRMFVSQTSINNPTSYVVIANADDEKVTFVAQSESGYPIYNDK